MANQSAVATFTGAGNTVAVTWPAMVGAYGVNWGIGYGVVTTDGGAQVVVDMPSAPTNAGGTVRVSDPSWQGSVPLSLYDMP